MRKSVTYYPDLGLVFGRFRVIVRTDGRWAVVDPTRPMAKGTVAVEATKEEAVTAAKRLAAEASEGRA